MTNATYPERWLFDETMAEISGLGGGYEDACRRMFAAGGAWADAHPEEWSKVKTLSDLPKAMDHLMVLACEGEDPTAGPTGAMMGAVTNCIYSVEDRGWEWFVDHFREGRHDAQ